MIYAMKIFVKLYIERNGTLCHVSVMYIDFFLINENVELELEYFGMCLEVLIQIYFHMEQQECKILHLSLKKKKICHLFPVKN